VNSEQVGLESLVEEAGEGEELGHGRAMFASRLAKLVERSAWAGV